MTVTWFWHLTVFGPVWNVYCFCIFLTPGRDLLVFIFLVPAYLVSCLLLLWIYFIVISSCIYFGCAICSGRNIINV